MNIRNRITQFFRLIWTYLQIGWMILCGVGNRTNAQLLAFVRAELIILGACLGFFVVGFSLNISGLVIFAGVISSLVVLVTWKLTDLGINLISAFAGITSKTPLVGNAVATPISATNEELKKLLHPLITTSLVLSFIAAITAIKGPASYTWHDLVIFATSLLTIIIFLYWVDSKTHFVGYAIMGMLAYVWVVNYMWPVQAQGLITWIERYTIHRSMVANDNSKKNDLVAMPNNTPLFEKSRGRFEPTTKTSETETVAKLVSQTKDPDSGEPMYEVILPVSPNCYVRGKKVFVPARLAKAVKVASSTADKEVAFEQTYTGQGFGENDWVPTANFGTDIKIGYKYTVRSVNSVPIEVYNNKRWERHEQGENTFTNVKGTDGPLGVKIKKGEPFMVLVRKA